MSEKKSKGQLKREAQYRAMLRADPTKLQRHGWRKIPCDEPKGYFWQRDADGAYRLYREPTPEMMARRRVIYDEANDRSILESAWGYVKPSYHHGDIR